MKVEATLPDGVVKVKFEYDLDPLTIDRLWRFPQWVRDIADGDHLKGLLKKTYFIEIAEVKFDQSGAFGFLQLVEVRN